MKDGERTVSTSGNKSILRIYIGKHCWSCEEALRLAAEVKKRFSGLFVDVVDLDNVDSVNHDDVFSVPTYVFNGSIISLGNPTLEELFAKISASVDSESALHQVI